MFRIKCANMKLILLVALVFSFGACDSRLFLLGKAEPVWLYGGVGEAPESALYLGDTYLSDLHITLDDVLIVEKMYTGVDDIVLHDRDGERYMRISATWYNPGPNTKTLDNEGPLVIYDNGRKVFVPEAELILVRGWLTRGITIPPQSEYTAKVVYRIPDIEGISIWWQNDAFYLSTL